MKKKRKKRSPEEIAAEELHESPEKRPGRLEERQINEPEDEEKEEAEEGREDEVFQQKGYLPGDDPSDWFTDKNIEIEEKKRRSVEKKRKR
ncbi:MAG: hypothetical protein GF408_05270 [Candidatus Omnitrophica bacterium]|nr:hypothetical protein [Candidatus Omnitrophota bacterium]